jgi:hypothetical protein
VKTIYGSQERGIDGGKKVKGRKRHIIVDTLGNLLHVEVKCASIVDTKDLDKSLLLLAPVLLGKGRWRDVP